MTKKGYDRIFCDSEFKKMLKTKAAQKGVTTLKFTQMLSSNPKLILNNESSVVEDNIITKKKISKSDGGKFFDSIF